MGKLIITEDEKRQIKSLYEQTNKQVQFGGSTPNATEFNRYVQEVGNDWEGFMGSQFSNDSLIKNVMNYYNGKSSQSQRNEISPFMKLLGDEKGIFGFSFAKIVEQGDTFSVYFTLLKDGKEISKSETYSYRGAFSVKSMCRGTFFLSNLSEPGKYTITNSIDNTYYLTFEI